MGEYADEALDAGMDEWGFDADADNEYRSPRMNSKLPECSRCGSLNVEWTHTRQGWRLRDIDTMELHNCSKVSAADFDDLSEG